MENKQSCLRDFQVLNKLGEGAFGQVYKVKRILDGKEYALKKIRIGSMKPKDKQNAINQVRILASYDDEFIIGFKEAFYDQISQTLCMVMEFAAGGDILKLNQIHLKQRTRYKEEEIWTALVHMTTGLKSLHEKKILHRDLKCANVFVTADKKYKLGDLNVSKVLKKELACTQTGTPYYASPEVWKDQPYGVKSDMWSLGCVLYEMAALRPPFTANDLSGLYKKVCIGIFQRIPKQYSNDLQGIISSLLKLDAKKRPDTKELLNNALVHKYYKGEMQTESKDDLSKDGLLQTIKFNPKDLKGLKNNLPKANYITQQESQEQKSSRNIKKEIELKKEIVVEPKIEIKKQTSEVNPISIKKIMSIEENEKKLKQFIEKRRMKEQKDRENHLLMLKEENQQLVKKKERILSACGVRNQFVCESPKMALHRKEEIPFLPPPNSCKPTRKDQNSAINAKLPPKPQYLAPIYKLPPKPNYHIAAVNPVNKSTDVSQKEREKSKENYRNLGARIVNDCNPIPMTPNSRRVNRCNSAQKIVYPSWWG